MTPDPLVDRLRAAGCVFAEEEAALLRSTASGDALEALVVRRVAGEPLEQVLGWAELAGVRVAVAPGVFVPRQRTALLVRLAVGLEPRVLLDLGCGTGAITAAVLARRPAVAAYAVDVDPAAVAVARQNLPGATVLEGDLYAPLPSALRGHVDVVCANAPYVPNGEVALMPREARDHEHLVALDGGADGLDVQRRVVAEAPRWLRPGGAVLVETSRAQAEGTAAAMRAAGLDARIERDEELDATVAVGNYRERCMDQTEDS